MWQESGRNVVELRSVVVGMWQERFAVSTSTSRFLSQTGCWGGVATRNTSDKFGRNYGKNCGRNCGRNCDGCVAELVGIRLDCDESMVGMWLELWQECGGSVVGMWLELWQELWLECVSTGVRLWSKCGRNVVGTGMNGRTIVPGLIIQCQECGETGIK